MIRGVAGSWCSVCGEVVVNGMEAGRISTIMLLVGTSKQRVVDRNFVRQVRRKLALDQQQAATIFGGGINAFSRYERGTTRPSLALIKLLLLLDEHPELLQEIRAEYPYASDSP